MAYKVMRVQVSAFRDKFKGTETDTDFQAMGYPELDEFLSTMEERGWEVVHTDFGTNGAAYFLFFTLRQQESGELED